MPHLAFLGLNGDLSAFDVDLIGQLDQLIHLQIGFSLFIDNSVVTALTTALPNLNSFGAPYTLLDDLNAIFDFDRIEYLDVSGTPLTNFAPAIANQILKHF